MLLSLFLALASLTPGDTPEWGGFRGNNGTGIATSEHVPAALDPAVNLLWRTEIPSGYSSPVVAGKCVLITGAEEKELVTLCLERANGKIRWRSVLPFDGKRPGANSPAAPSPATDGERVYALFHGFGLVAYDFEGKELWRAPMGPFNIPHGLATSPVVHEGLVVVLVDQDLGAYLAAFDAKTGKERWKIERPGVVHGYSTPALYMPEKGPAEIVVSGSFQVAGYSLADGQKLWWVDGGAWQTKCVPVVVGDRCYVASYMMSTGDMGFPRFTQTFAELLAERDADKSGTVERSEWPDPGLQQAWAIFDQDDDGKFNESDWEFALQSARATGALFAIKLGGRGDLTESGVEWKYDGRRGLPDFASPLVAANQLVTASEGGVLTAFDLKTGEVRLSARIGEPDGYFASPVSAAGRIFCASQSGGLCVVAAELPAAEGSDQPPEAWNVLSCTKLDEEIWSTPAIAGDQVFVRSLEALYCFRDPDPEDLEEEEG